MPSRTFERPSRHAILKFMNSLRAPHYRRERLLPPKAHRRNFYNKLRNNASIRTWTLVGRGYRWGIDSYVCWVVCLGLALAIFLALSEHFFLVAKKANIFLDPGTIFESGNIFWICDFLLKTWKKLDNAIFLQLPNISEKPNLFKFVNITLKTVFFIFFEQFMIFFLKN